MSEKQIEHTHCLIIGSGPAGYTAAIYAARASLNPVLYTGIQIGGQLTTTTDVENFPGYPNGITGPEMMEEFRKQAERFGTDIRYAYVTSIDLQSNPKRAIIDDGQEITADAVIIASGASAKWLGLPAEKKLNGAGVSACAVCDGFFFRNQDVAVVGGGDTACEEAAYLSKLCKKVYLIVRRNELRASKVMQERIQKIPNIEILWGYVTQDIIGETSVTGAILKNLNDNTEKQLSITGFFVAIGHQPNTGFLAGQLNLDANGYIITQGKSTYTNIEGVFACGDIQDATYRQAVTAAGSGCMAALDAERWLAAREL